MTALVDIGLYPELQRFGATDMTACFSCGNCTAICPLSENDATFPRRMIRYAQVGHEGRAPLQQGAVDLLPLRRVLRQLPHRGRPGRVHGGRPPLRDRQLRRDRARPARCTCGRPWARVIALALAVFFALFMYTARGPQSTETLAIFEFIPAELIHDIGIVVMVLVFAAGLVGVARMARRIGRREGVGWRSVLGSRAALARSGRALWSSLGRESLGQARYRAECETETASVAWYRRRWFIHAMVLWGFLGLLAATILDYGLDILGIKETGTPVPDLVPGPPAGHRRRPHARVRHHRDDHRPRCGRPARPWPARRRPTGRSWRCSGSPG